LSVGWTFPCTSRNYDLRVVQRPFARRATGSLTVALFTAIMAVKTAHAGSGLSLVVFVVFDIKRGQGRIITAKNAGIIFHFVGGKKLFDLFR
jgi:hypothetical protein